jgi:hypothetical protein
MVRKKKKTTARAGAGATGAGGARAGHSPTAYAYPADPDGIYRSPTALPLQDYPEDPAAGGVLEELGEWSTAHAHHTFHTAPAILQKECDRAEDLEHERNKAAIWQAKPAALEEVANVISSSPGAPPPRPSRKDPEVAKRRAHIRSLGNVSNLDYWKGMDKKYRTPAAWQEWGCPPSYVDASRDPNKDVRDHFLRVQAYERKNARREKPAKSIPGKAAE